MEVFSLSCEVDFTNHISHIVAVVDWFKLHPDRDLLQPPLEVWDTDFMPLGPYSFVPVNGILCPVGFAMVCLK